MLGLRTLELISSKTIDHKVSNELFNEYLKKYKTNKPLYLHTDENSARALLKASLPNINVDALSYNDVIK